MMDLTPLEVRKKKGDFRRAMRGYDSLLVDDFLDLVADRLEQLVRENLSLQERVTRQEQLVTEYRDRERALTEALVSAQEMREEVRRQSAREADLARSTAQQEAAQMRSAAEQEALQLVTGAEQEGARLRAAAEQEAQQVRSASEQEAAQLRGELARLQSSIAIEREREEETVRHLRARQQQFLASYRAFLERELTELGALAKTLAAVTGADYDQSALEELSSALYPAAQPVLDVTAAPRTERARVAEVVSLDAEPFEPEPFEPEPFEPDEDVSRAAPDEELDMAASGQTAFDDTGADGVGSAAEPTLYDGVAENTSREGIPGPIGLAGGPDDSAARAWRSPDLTTEMSALDMDDTDQPDMVDLELIDEAPDIDDFDLDTEDADTNELLRNAAAAGYQLTEESPPEEELLLDEAVIEEETPSEDDDGWLPTLLDDEK